MPDPFRCRATQLTFRTQTQAIEQMLADLDELGIPTDRLSHNSDSTICVTYNRERVM